MGKFPQKLGSLITMLMLLSLATAPLHEWSHVMMTRVMGGDAYVTYSPGYVASGGFTHFITVPDHGLWWVYFAGGFGVFLGCMVLWLWARISKTMWDMNMELPALMIGLMQFFYAFLEAWIYPTNPELFWSIYGIAYGAGALVAIGIESKRAWKWLTTKEIITREELYW
jgi:hypothetical protein